MSRISKTMFAATSHYTGSILLLLPKKNGKGFLKTPVSHHFERWHIEVPFDMCGLDVFIEIVDKSVHTSEDLELFMQKYYHVFEKRFGTDSYKIVPWGVIFEIHKNNKYIPQ